MKMKIVDLFSGCGGLSLGFQRTGFDIVAAFEFWEVAASCYERNFTHPVFRTDLSNTEEAIEIIRNFSSIKTIKAPKCSEKLLKSL